MSMYFIVRLICHAGVHQYIVVYYVHLFRCIVDSLSLVECNSRGLSRSAQAFCSAALGNAQKTMVIIVFTITASNKTASDPFALRRKAPQKPPTIIEQICARRRFLPLTNGSIREK